jgi:hypothetical protein
MPVKVLKAILTKGGWIQRYWMLPATLAKYEKTGQVFHRYKVLKRIVEVVKVFALVTVRLDYKKRGHPIDFEVNYSEETNRANLKRKQDQLFNKIWNGIFSYFGAGLADLVDKTVAGYSTADSAELSAYVRGRSNEELESYIRQSPDSRQYLKEVE